MKNLTNQARIVDFETCHHEFGHLHVQTAVAGLVHVDEEHDRIVQAKRVLSFQHKCNVFAVV